MIRLAPATADDFTALFDQPPPCRLRAVTAHVDGVPAAMGGLAYQSDGTILAVYAGRTAIERFPKTIHRAIRAGLEQARDRGVTRIVAHCDPTIAAAERWLRRLGFVPAAQPGFWVWEA